jgi:hypothetical protein
MISNVLSRLSVIKALPAACVSLLIPIIGLWLEVIFVWRLLDGKATVLIPLIGLALVPFMLRSILVASFILIRLATDRIGVGYIENRLYYIHPIILSIDIESIRNIQLDRQFIFPLNRSVATVNLNNGAKKRILLSLLTEPAEDVVARMRSIAD